jgi:cytochrome b6-f complex iron-sulfur subunit
VVWVAGVTIPSAVYLWPARSGGPTKKFVTVDIADWKFGSARVLQESGAPILVLREAGGGFVALSAICTHLGCIVQWHPEQRRILCPCHAGVFAADGRVVSGPPPRPLRVYPCEEVGGQLRIET